MEENVKKFKASKIIVPILIIIAVLIASSLCYTTIPTGYTGVVTTFGKVMNYTLDAGFHIKAPWQNVVKMDNRIQKQTVEMSCFSSDIQEVSLIYTVNYQISKRDAMTIYSTIGKNYYDTVISPAISESVKIVTAKYTAEALVGNRTQLAASVEDDLAAKLKNYNIELISTSIENMDFTDAFTNAVEAKQVAQQNKLKAETEASQKVIEANAEAEVKKINAEAEAYEVVVKAKAEAEANELLSKSLTQEILEKMYYEKWDGNLPNVVGSGATSLINMPIGE